MVLPYTIETDGRQAGANQHMVLTHTIETDGRRPHNRNRWPHNSRATAFCHAWPILLFALQPAFTPLLSTVDSPPPHIPLLPLPPKSSLQIICPASEAEVSLFLNSLPNKQCELD